MTKRKSLKPVELTKQPTTTAAARKAVQATNREEVLAHPMATDHTDWMFKVARGDIEAPAAVQTLCLKELNSSLYGLEEDRTKGATDKITINIVGIDANEGPSVIIEGEAKAVSDE
jgi:hypothetical protein